MLRSLVGSEMCIRDRSVVDSVVALLELVELRKTRNNSAPSIGDSGTPIDSLLNHILDELDSTSIPDTQSGGGIMSGPSSANNRMGGSYDAVDGAASSSGPQSPLSNASSTTTNNNNESPYSSSITGFRARRQHFQQRPRGQSMSTLMNSSSLDVADEVLYFTWDYVYPLIAPVLEDSCRQLSDVKCWAADIALTVQRLQKNPSKGLFGVGKLSKGTSTSAASPHPRQGGGESTDDGLNNDNEQSTNPTTATTTSSSSWEDAVPPTSRAYMKLEQNYSKLISHISSKAFNHSTTATNAPPLSMSPFQRAAVHAVNTIFLHRNVTTNVSANRTHVPQPTTVNSGSRVTDNGKLLFSPRGQLDTRTTLSVSFPTSDDIETAAAADNNNNSCLLYTSDAADEEDSVDLGGRRIIKKKKIIRNYELYECDMYVLYCVD
eukprot:TRINITY_DN23157_c0_g1_i1.p1 TRINITY_DN23157_c0_g1~~TRINITY_DN23157_c0_g1_i1.p1  ORF type:complete len:434 (+),score=92.96 TRINITY_DN23157_c0_g1_i1:113-1414(+)